jgi:hypothetical protein
VWQSVISTAAQVYEPDDGVGLLGLVIVGLPATVTALGTVWVLVRQRGTQTAVTRAESKIDAVNASVNNRPTTARDDIDRLITAVEKTTVTVAELRGEVRGLTHRVDQWGKP